MITGCLDINEILDKRTKCEECGAEAKVDMSLVYASIPPKYSYECEKCGHVGYVTDDEIYDAGQANKNACAICGKPTDDYFCSKCRREIRKACGITESEGD